jgi:hypothetical protein
LGSGTPIAELINGRSDILPETRPIIKALGGNQSRPRSGRCPQHLDLRWVLAPHMLFVWA